MKYSYAEFAPLLKIIADETRLKIIEMLSHGTLCACDILENLEIYQQQSESMFLNESIKSIIDFENKLELEKKDKKLLLQKNKIKLAESKQLFITIALILTILLLILET